MTQSSGRLQVAVAAFLFSTGGVAIKATDLSGVEVAGLRSGVAAAVLALLLPGWRRCWDRRSLLVGSAYAATLVLFVLANKRTTAANAIFLQSTAPIWVMALAPRLLGERGRAGDIGFAAMLAAGLALFFVGSEAPVASAPNPTSGNVIAVLAGLAWAFALMGLRWLGRGEAGGDAAGRAVVAGNALAFAACLPFVGSVAAAGTADWLTILYLGVFQIGLAYVFMTRGVRTLPAVEVSLLLLLEPVLSALLAWAIYGEGIGVAEAAGCALILAAALGRTLRDARTSR